MGRITRRCRESCFKENKFRRKRDRFSYLKDGKAIGSFHVHTISYSDHKAEIGYGIEKGEEGKGYVSESLQLVVAEMKRLGFNKVVINCDRNNVRSIQVAERNGFQREGLLLQDCIEYGRFRDSVIFGKILR
ncbi:MAG: GNAT family N-acetyltransferase [Bdellovibrionales bacterium]|nr:GNAT family N-acetyltransferase [Bdellovibrionales bacterium]